MRRSLVFLGTAAWLIGAAPAVGAPASSAHSYLIMPFENTAEDPALDWLSAGLAHSLGEYLLGFGQQVMDPEERTVLLEASGIPPGAPIALASALELGRRTLARPTGLRVDRLVLGRFNVDHGDITIAGRIIDLKREKARPWQSRSGRLKDLLQVGRDLAVVMARDQKIAISDAREELLSKQTEDVPLLAFETYCRAVSESDSKERLRSLRKALQQYPGYPKAAYQAGALLVREERWEEAATVLGKASSDPFPYESDYHLLIAQVALGRKDPQTAVAEARRALTLAETARGHLLLGRALQASGDSQAALTELEKAKSADPTDAEIEELRRTIERVKNTGRTP